MTNTKPLRPHFGLTAVALLAVASFAPCAFAQTTLTDMPGTLPDAPGLTSSSLPDAPQSTATYISGSGNVSGGAQTGMTVSTTDKYINPGEVAPRLTVANKFALGFKDAFSIPALAGWATSAGYAQLTNGSPNYGTNSVAYGKRFGAAVARASSEGVFSDSVMASVLHEDPRYYRMGPGHNFLKRTAYAATRAIITRTDSGRTTPNLALLSGNLGGSYLTKAYYPDLNTSNVEVLKTFGGSIGGSAIGFVFSEFLPNGFNIFHKKN